MVAHSGVNGQAGYSEQVMGEVHPSIGWLKVFFRSLCVESGLM